MVGGTVGGTVDATELQPAALALTATAATGPIAIGGAGAAATGAAGASSWSSSSLWLPTPKKPCSMSSAPPAESGSAPKSSNS